jgi:hypothetical protein
MVALSLRITVEMFRVLSQDGEKLSAKSLLNYYNSTELIPYSINQLMELFEIYTNDNLENLDFKALEAVLQEQSKSAMLCAGNNKQSLIRK